MISTHSDWFLCGTAGAEPTRAVVRVDRMPFVIGRRPGLNLTLDSLCVSGRHAELSTRGERLFVVDLGSRNGTQVNGKRIRNSPLGIGDLLKVGDVEFRLDRRPRNEKKARTAPAAADLDAMELKWLGTQFDELISGPALTAELRPIVQLCDETVAAYEARGQSQIAGLETEAKMCDAARVLGREKDLNQLLLHCCEGVVGKLPAGCWLLLRTPAAVNLESEVIPVLKVLRARAPQARIVVEVLDAPLRNLRSLKDFVAALKTLDVQLVLGNFVWEHMRFLQSSRLLPLAVRLDPTLTQNMAQKSETERKRLKGMVGSLHQYRIRSIAPAIETPEDARSCDQLDIDFAVGPLFDESMSVPGKPMLDTCVLSMEQLSALNAAPAASPQSEQRTAPEQQAPNAAALVVEAPAAEAPVEDRVVAEVQLDEIPVDHVPVDHVPVDHVPVDHVPVDHVPVEHEPVDHVAVDHEPVDHVPVDQEPVDHVAVDQEPVDFMSVDHVATEQAPVDHVSPEYASAVEVAVDEAVLDEAAVDEWAFDDAPVDELPGNDLPIEELPIDEVAVFELCFDETDAPPDEWAHSTGTVPHEEAVQHHETAASAEFAPLEELVLPEDLEFPEEMPGESNVSVLEDENDITADIPVDFGSVAFRLPPPRRS